VDILIFVLSFVGIVLLGTFIHELGHALAARIIAFKRVRLSIGSGKELTSFQFLHIEWKFHMICILGGYTSYETPRTYHPLDVAFVAMMGPIFNGITFLLIDLFTDKLISTSLYVFLLFNGWMFLANIVPLKWKEKQSDGYLVLKMILQHIRTERV